MNPDLQKLHPYPFEKLLQLKAGITPPANKSHIALSIGEPKHAPPEFVKKEMRQYLDRMGSYPLSKGIVALREAMVQWLIQRFNLKPDSLHADKHILPVNGTREALFAFAQAVVDRSQPTEPRLLSWRVR